MTIETLIKKYDGDRAKIKGALLLDGKSEKEANEIIKAAGLTRKRANFRAELYDALANGPLDADAFKKMLEGQTQNVLNHESHYNEIRLLANRVWEAAKAKK